MMDHDDRSVQIHRLSTAIKDARLSDADILSVAMKASLNKRKAQLQEEQNKENERNQKRQKLLAEKEAAVSKKNSNNNSFSSEICDTVDVTVPSLPIYSTSPHKILFPLNEKKKHKQRNNNQTQTTTESALTPDSQRAPTRGHDEEVELEDFIPSLTDEDLLKSGIDLQTFSAKQINDSEALQDAVDSKEESDDLTEEERQSQQLEAHKKRMIALRDQLQKELLFILNQGTYTQVRIRRLSALLFS